LTTKIVNLGIIYRAIKSAGNISYFFLSEKEQIFNTKAMVTSKRSAAVVKKLKNYEHLALSKTQKQTHVASGLH